jgi:limonene-1,2-epoxide hydrolase
MASSSTPIEVVERFCASIASGDLDSVIAFFTDDAVYHNIPMDPVVGPAAIRATIEGFTGMVESLEFRMVHISASGNTVLTERVDVFNFPTSKIELPVMGAFDVVGEQITGWRDYFDLNQFMSQLPQG